ncbi:MAG TPA: MG2 domain-containing protein, partial [Pedobacter sp.]
MLIAGDSKNDSLSDVRTSYASFSVTGMAVTTRITEDGYQYMVTDNLSGIPMKDVHITENRFVYLNRKQLDEKGRSLLTDEDGRASSGVEERVSYLLVTHQKDSVVIPVSGYYNSYKPESRRVLLFTDRPVYRPGQTVFYKGLFMQNEKDRNSILADQQLDLTFQDVNYKEIEKVSVTTNSYGTFQGSFKIPMGKLNGTMKLSTLYGSIDVQV